MHSLLRSLAGIIVLITIGGALYVMSIPESGSSVTVGESETMSESSTTTPEYTSARYGIAFRYPDTYTLFENENDSGSAPGHHVITLMNTVAAAQIPEGGEGPTAITIEIFEHDLAQQSLEQWIMERPDSHYSRSIDGVLSEDRVADVRALSYQWDGLYRGESTVFAHRGAIYVASVTYLTPSDQIRADFERIRASIRVN